MHVVATVPPRNDRRDVPRRAAVDRAAAELEVTKAVAGIVGRMS
jgi:hypothetical protein